MKGDALVGNAADRGQVAEADKAERRGKIRDQGDLQAVLSSIAGRRVLWKIMKYCGVNECVFTGDDAHTNFRAGRQDVGHFVLAEIVEAAPERYLEMMRENQKEKE